MSKNYIPTYEEKENRKINLDTELIINKIHKIMLEEDRIPDVAEVEELTGFAYHYAAEVRRKAIKRFPRIDIEEIVEGVKKELLKRIESGEVDTTNLVRLMPYVSEQKGSKSDIRQEITHRFIVLKPDEANTDDDLEDAT